MARPKEKYDSERVGIRMSYEAIKAMEWLCNRYKISKTEAIETALIEYAAICKEHDETKGNKG